MIYLTEVVLCSPGGLGIYNLTVNVSPAALTGRGDAEEGCIYILLCMHPFSVGIHRRRTTWGQVSILVKLLG